MKRIYFYKQYRKTMLRYAKSVHQLDIPVSQRLPVYPGAHAHLNKAVYPCLMQVLLCWQSVLIQGSVAIKKQFHHSSVAIIVS